MSEQAAIIVGLIVVAAIVGALFALARRSSQRLQRSDASPVAIAQIVDPGLGGNSAVGTCALFLIGFTAISIFKYFSASTTDQQIVALLLWIGNSVFWGSLMIVGTLTTAKTSIVYREAPAPERAEPKL